jgi:hypothetical protein
MKDWRKNKKAVTWVVVILLILLLLGLQFLTTQWIPHKVPKPSKPKVTSKEAVVNFASGSGVSGVVPAYTSGWNTVVIDGVTATPSSANAGTYWAIIPVADATNGYYVTYNYALYQGAPVTTSASVLEYGTPNTITVNYADTVM